MVVKELTHKNFDENTKNGMSIIDFHAISWCAPCKALKPIFEQLSTEVKVPFYEVDVDAEPKLAQRFQIMSVPTTIILKDGKEEVLRINGALPKEEFKKRLLSKL